MLLKNLYLQGCAIFFSISQKFDNEMYMCNVSLSSLFKSSLIFQPPASITSPKAVMVFLHGGGFVRGTALPQSYPGDYLINYDVIVVTVAYRLHALGQ